MLIWRAASKPVGRSNSASKAEKMAVRSPSGITTTYVRSAPQIDPPLDLRDLIVAVPEPFGLRRPLLSEDHLEELVVRRGVAGLEPLLPGRGRIAPMDQRSPPR